LTGNAYAVERADISTLNFGDIVATSDSVLISKARAVFDLAGEIIKKNYSATILLLHDLVEGLATPINGKFKHYT